MIETKKADKILIIKVTIQNLKSQTSKLNFETYQNNILIEKKIIIVHAK